MHACTFGGGGFFCECPSIFVVWVMKSSEVVGYLLVSSALLQQPALPVSGPHPLGSTLAGLGWLLEVAASMGGGRGWSGYLPPLSNHAATEVCP